MAKGSQGNILSYGPVIGFLLVAYVLAQSSSEDTVEDAKSNDEDSTFSNDTKKLTGIPQIDYIHDPNLPRELNGFNLTNYPFYRRVPTNITFKCDGLHDGFYASVRHNCQVYHNCLFGVRYDFLCANYTAFDQKNFICHFASEVDCKNSPKYYSRNEALYKTTTEKPATTAVPRRPSRPDRSERPHQKPHMHIEDDHHSDDRDITIPIKKNKNHRRPTIIYVNYGDYYPGDGDYADYNDQKEPFYVSLTKPVRRRLKPTELYNPSASGSGASQKRTTMTITEIPAGKEEEYEEREYRPINRDSLFNQQRTFHPKVRIPVPLNERDRFYRQQGRESEHVATTTSSTTTSTTAQAPLEETEEYDELIHIQEESSKAPALYPSQIVNQSISQHQHKAKENLRQPSRSRRPFIQNSNITISTTVKSVSNRGSQRRRPQPIDEPHKYYQYSEEKPEDYQSQPINPAENPQYSRLSSRYSGHPSLPTNINPHEPQQYISPTASMANGVFSSTEASFSNKAVDYPQLDYQQNTHSRGIHPRQRPLPTTSTTTVLDHIQQTNRNKNTAKIQSDNSRLGTGLGNRGAQPVYISLLEDDEEEQHESSSPPRSQPAEETGIFQHPVASAKHRIRPTVQRRKRIRPTEDYEDEYD